MMARVIQSDSLTSSLVALPFPDLGMASFPSLPEMRSSAYWTLVKIAGRDISRKQPTPKSSVVL
jgi:hypothetical protein